MTEKTIYISFDNIEFADRDVCEEYEQMARNLKAVESKFMGPRPKYAEKTPDELKSRPDLTSTQHEAADVLKMARAAQTMLFDSGWMDSAAYKKVEYFISKLDENDRQESAIMWDNAIFELKNAAVMHIASICGRSEANKADFNTIARRIANTSPFSGIEYPERKWIMYEQDFERYAAEHRKYMANGCRYGSPE